MQNSQGTSYNPTKEMFKGSTLPEEYMMRTVFRDRDDQIGMLLEFMSTHRLTLGFSDPALVNWLDLMGRPAIDGPNNARKMVRDMTIGMRDREERMSSGILRRARTINQGEEITPQGKG